MTRLIVFVASVFLTQFASAGEPSAASVIEKPAANVPAACAAYVGVWSGVFPAGRAWLWIASVDADCTARYSYPNKTPTTFNVAQIKEGVLVIPRPNGTTRFEIRGDQIAARFSSASAETSATLEKVNLADGSLERPANTVFAAPTADVPAACAAFFGAWVGTWTYYYREMWLRVVNVDSKCVVKYSYRASKELPNTFATAEVKDGTLSVPCGATSATGTCDFQRSGDELHGISFKQGGGADRGTFRKMQ